MTTLTFVVARLTVWEGKQNILFDQTVKVTFGVMKMKGSNQLIIYLH